MRLLKLEIRKEFLFTIIDVDRFIEEGQLPCLHLLVLVEIMITIIIFP